jgi:proline iminopeptidase
MSAGAILAILASAAGPPARPGAAPADTERKAAAREVRVPVGKASLYCREIGQGPPVIVLHGGPDFDHGYLVPDLDRLADTVRLVYYDQRGRGRSGEVFEPADVTMDSEVEDLDAVRRQFGSGPVTILGHSWGTVLALEYAIRHPDRVSRLILMNPAPSSHDELLLLRKERRERWAADVEQLRSLAATTGYKEGDPDAVAAYYRVHFKAALARSEDLEKVLARLRATFTREGIIKARAIEDRLMEETWLDDKYDLLPGAAKLRIPTLVVSGDHEFIPAECSAHIAAAIPGARLVTLKDCGHFSYLECPDAVGTEVRAFLRREAAPARSR